MCVCVCACVCVHINVCASIVGGWARGGLCLITDLCMLILCVLLLGVFRAMFDAKSACVNILCAAIGCF